MSLYVPISVFILRLVETSQGDLTASELTKLAETGRERESKRQRRRYMEVERGKRSDITDKQQ